DPRRARRHLRGGQAHHRDDGEHAGDRRRGQSPPEAALEGLLHSSDPWRYVLLAALTRGPILPFASGLRFRWGACSREHGVEPTPLTPEHWGLFVSPNVLAVAGIIAGLVPAAGEALFISYANTYAEGAVGHLSLWAGFGIPLALTAVIIVVGALLSYRH